MSRIEEAFTRVKRRDFLPRSVQAVAGLDIPLSIGHGQTNSQPTTVRMMLEWLDPQPGDKVLDVGSGSGWTSALLAHIVGAKGRVYAVELVPQLVTFGRKNTEKAGIKNAEFFQAGDVFGLPDHAPYDCILVSASARELPHRLIDQLKVGGKLVIPVREDVLEITKTVKESYETKTHPGFMFVPLV